MKLDPPTSGVQYIRVSTAIGDFLGKDVGQAIAIDITDRVERNRQLEILDQWLRHNIRNEMAVIQTIADNIEHGVVSDERVAARTIQDHVTRLLEQVDYERDITNILTAAADRDRTPIPVTEVVEPQRTDFQERHPDATIEVTYSDEFDVVALPSIRDAVRELLENAIEHTDAEWPTVEIHVELSDDGQGLIRVADNGPGIPETERACLLLDGEIDQLSHNSGLGLVLVYWVVRLSDGEITFEENDPRGSIVTLSLPLQP